MQGKDLDLYLSPSLDPLKPIDRKIPAFWPRAAPVPGSVPAALVFPAQHK